MQSTSLGEGPHGVSLTETENKAYLRLERRMNETMDVKLSHRQKRVLKNNEMAMKRSSGQLFGNKDN